MDQHTATRARRTGFVLAAIAAVGAACGSPTPTTSADPQLELGRTVFARRCASCHGAKGDGSVGPKLADGTVVTKYPDPAAQRVVIADGRNGMPKWSGILRDDEIDAVVRYTREGL